MFSGINTYVMAGLALVIVIISGLSYWYFTYSQREMGILRENAARLEQAVQTQTATIQALEQHARAQAQNLMTLQTDLSGAETTRRNLESRLRRANIQVMARTQAVELERRINQDTVEAFADLERITSSSSSSARPSAAARNSGSTEAVRAAPATSTTTGQPPPRPPVRSSP